MSVFVRGNGRCNCTIRSYSPVIHPNTTYNHTKEIGMSFNHESRPCESLGVRAEVIKIHKYNTGSYSAKKPLAYPVYNLPMRTKATKPVSSAPTTWTTETDEPEVTISALERKQRRGEFFYFSLT